MNHLYSKKKSCQEATLKYTEGLRTLFFMILWKNKDFVQRLEESILKNHQDDRFFFTTYNDKDCFGNSLDEEQKYIRSFYMKQTKEMMKNVGVHGYLNYKVEPNSIWVQMNNKSDPRIHDHHGEDLMTITSDQPRSFFFINSRGQKLYPKQVVIFLLSFLGTARKHKLTAIVLSLQVDIQSSW